MDTPKWNREYAKFLKFNHDIDQERPFGLRIRVDAETLEAEAGTICLLPNHDGAPLHKHTDQDEFFTVMEGELLIQAGTTLKTLKAGESIRIERHTPHTYANRSDRICVFSYQLTPGGEFTRMMRSLEALAKSGKLSALGEPKTMIRIAGVISKYDHHVRSVRPPHFVMKAMGALSRFL